MVSMGLLATVLACTESRNPVPPMEEEPEDSLPPVEPPPPPNPIPSERVPIRGQVHALSETLPEGLKVRAWTGTDTIEADVSESGEFSILVPKGALDSTVVVVGQTLTLEDSHNPSLKVLEQVTDTTQLDVLLIPRSIVLPGGTWAGRTVQLPIHLAGSPENMLAGGDGMFWIIAGWPDRDTADGPGRELWTSAWPDDGFPIPVYFKPAGTDFDGRELRAATSADSISFWNSVEAMERTMGRDFFRPAHEAELEAVELPAGIPGRVGAIAVRLLARIENPFAGINLLCDAFIGPFIETHPSCERFGPGRLVFGSISINTVYDLYPLQHELLHALGFGHGCWTPTLIGFCHPVFESEFLGDDGSYTFTPTPWDIGYMELYWAIHRRSVELRPHMGLLAAMDGARRLWLGAGPLPRDWLVSIGAIEIPGFPPATAASAPVRTIH